MYMNVNELNINILIKKVKNQEQLLSFLVLSLVQIKIQCCQLSTSKFSMKTTICS